MLRFVKSLSCHMVFEGFIGWLPILCLFSCVTVKSFPCYIIVLNKVTLCSGNKRVGARLQVEAHIRKAKSGTRILSESLSGN